MIFKIADSSVSGIIADTDDKKEATLFKDDSGWSFEKKSGMLYCVVRAVSASINGNGDAFSEEVIKNSYQTFVGKGVFVNHASNDVEKQRGLIIDAKLDKDIEGLIYVKCLMEINAQAYPEFAQMIRAGHLRDVSMGASVKYSTCSVCGNKSSSVKDYCTHIKFHKGGVFGGKQVYEDNHDVEFIECSFVNKGADAQAKVLEVIARQHGLELQSMLQKAAKDPTYTGKLQAEADLLKDDDGCVEDDTSEEEGIHPPVHDLNAIKSEAGVIIDRINNLLYLASEHKKLNKNVKTIYAEVNKWQLRLKEVQKQAEEEKFIKLLIKANRDLKAGIINENEFKELTKLANEHYPDEMFEEYNIGHGMVSNPNDKEWFGNNPSWNKHINECSDCRKALSQNRGNNDPLSYRQFSQHNQPETDKTRQMKNLFDKNLKPDKEASLRNILKLAAKMCISGPCKNPAVKGSKYCTTCNVGRIGPATNVRPAGAHKNPKNISRQKAKEEIKKKDWDE